MNTTPSHVSGIRRSLARGFGVLGLAVATIVVLFAFEAAPLRGTTNEAFAWSCSINATSVTTSTGAEVTLTWSAANDTSYVTIDYFPGEQFPITGTKKVSITQTTTFTAYTHVSWTTDTLSCKTTVTVQPPVNTCDAASVTLGEKSFTWNGPLPLDTYTVEFCDGTKETQNVCYPPGGATLTFAKFVKSVKACGSDCTKIASQTCPTPPPPPSCTMTATPSTIVSGNPSTISWTSKDASSVVFENISSSEFTGNTQVTPTVTTTYKGTFSGATGTVPAVCTATVTVEPPAPSCDNVAFTITDNSFTWDGPPALSHYTAYFCDGGTTGKIEHGTWGDPATITLAKRIASVSAKGGTCEKTVTQSCPPPPPEDPACSMNVSPVSIMKGDNATLSWTSTDALSAVFSGFSSNLLTGSITVSPTETTTYSGVFHGATGTTDAQCSATVTVITPPPAPNDPSCTITASPARIARGATTTISWTSSDALSAVFSGFTSSLLTGTTTVAPTETITYAGTFHGATGTEDALCSVTVTVDQPVNPACSLTVNPNTIVRGGHADLTWTSFDAFAVTWSGIVSSLLNGTVSVSPTATTTYSGTFTGADGTTPVVCSATLAVIEPPVIPLPTCSMSISPAKVSKGKNATLTWSSTNAQSANIDQGVGTTTLSGTKSVTVQTATTYTGTFTNSDGASVTCSAHVSLESSGGGGKCLNCDTKSSSHTSTTKNTKTPPSIVLSEKTTKPGSITLGQVPYTGFTATPAMTVFFWLVVFALSAGLAYAVTFFKQRLSLRVAELPMVPGTRMLTDREVLPPLQVRPASGRVEPIVLSQAPTSSDPVHRIEERAHKDNILLSPEAVRMIVTHLHGSSTDEEHTLDELFTRTKSLYPREDGWILLSKERCARLLEQATPAVPPQVAAPLRTDVKPVREEVSPASLTARSDVRSQDSVPATFVTALVKNDKAKAFDILRSLGTHGVDMGTFITRVVRDLDDVYKQRIEGNRTPDQGMVQLTQSWTPATFEAVLGALVECIDYSYSNQRTAAKVGLAKVFETFAQNR